MCATDGAQAPRSRAASILTPYCWTVACLAGAASKTLERLRAEPDTSATPVILMTALARGSDQAVPPGFAGVIGKPFDPITLPQQIGIF